MLVNTNALVKFTNKKTHFGQLKIILLLIYW